MTARGKRDTQDIERARGQEDRILSMLRAAGPAGCTNSQLWTVAHAVNSRISDLRKRGHKITTESEGRGIWRPRLVLAEPRQPRDWQDRTRVTGLPLFDAGVRQ
jgi:hypothetical protein